MKTQTARHKPTRTEFFVVPPNAFDVVDLPDGIARNHTTRRMYVYDMNGNNIELSEGDVVLREPDRGTGLIRWYVLDAKTFADHYDVVDVEAVAKLVDDGRLVTDDRSSEIMDDDTERLPFGHNEIAKIVRADIDEHLPLTFAGATRVYNDALIFEFCKGYNGKKSPNAVREAYHAYVEGEKPTHLFHRDAVDAFMSTVRGAIRIPAGTKARKCRGRTCTDMIYDVSTGNPRDKPKPVSVKKYKDNSIGIPPTDTEDGAGINHFADCPDAPQFRR